MTTEVRCTVHSCEFWGKGDYCTADQIWVMNNLAPAEDDDFFFDPTLELGDEPGTERVKGGPGVGDAAADTSHQTCCETMRPKKEGPGDSHRGCCR